MMHTPSRRVVVWLLMAAVLLSQSLVVWHGVAHAHGSSGSPLARVMAAHADCDAAHEHEAEEAHAHAPSQIWDAIFGHTDNEGCDSWQGLASDGEAATHGLLHVQHAAALARFAAHSPISALAPARHSAARAPPSI
jgi:predicted carbohydrate-binding protein with CBM5 and CBM33 domain